MDHPLSRYLRAARNPLNGLPLFFQFLTEGTTTEATSIRLW